MFKHNVTIALLNEQKGYAHKYAKFEQLIRNTDIYIYTVPQ